MADGPATKRARLACRNCRRKKTRCGGEKPVCSVCARLGQTCEYPVGPPVPRPSTAEELDLEDEPNLSARVRFLEQQLGISRSRQVVSPPSVSSITESSRHESHLSPNLLPASGDGQHNTDKFTVVPPMPVLEDLTDKYFTNFHNQPYSYFLETAFRTRLQDGALPKHVLLAFSATAARYSNHQFFEGRNNEAMETYARKAWNIVLHQVFSSEQGLDLYVVQSTNLLAIIDFTAGQHRLGWVKIGLAVRFAQGLKLNVEPDPLLPLWQQEERRRVFWSVYMLDRFVSCSRARSATISDRDCTVRLPVSDDEVSSRAVPGKIPTLAVLKQVPDMEKCRKLCDFALTILMCSILSRVIRYSLQHNFDYESPPWDFRSDFTRIRSTLFCFERLLADDFSTRIQSRLKDDVRWGDNQSYSGKQQIGPYIWCRALYYLCGCLLHHPFMLHGYLKHYRDTFPPSFARQALSKCREDSERLADILSIIQKTQCCVRGSFLGYMAVTSSSLNRLYQYSTNESIKSRAALSFETCLAFLEQPPHHWQTYRTMAVALRQFDVEQDMARKLIEPSLDDEEIASEDIDTLWRIVDYGWLTDFNRTDPPFMSSLSQAAQAFNWQFFEELINCDFTIPSE